MTAELLEVVEDGVALLTINRPERRNALSHDLMNGLLEALGRLAKDTSVGCVVLRGAGKDAFCAGGDVKVLAAGGRLGPNATTEEKNMDLREKGEISRLLSQMPKPTIAMVNGVAAGAGMAMALACDMRFVARSARMTTAFARIGLNGDFGGLYFLTRLVGPSIARELYFTADQIDSARIEKLGLATRVVEDDALEAETMAFARRFGQGPKLAYHYIKLTAVIAETGTLSDVLDSELVGAARVRDSADFKEGSAAFIEKRQPKYIGR